MGTWVRSNVSLRSSCIGSFPGSGLNSSLIFNGFLSSESGCPDYFNARNIAVQPETHTHTFLVELGFELKETLFCLKHASSPFCSSYFGDGVLRSIFLGWPGTSILPISASQVARITGVSH
jgi:hypothetical protein